MRNKISIPRRLGIRGICMALLWPAMTVECAGPADARALSGLFERSVSLNKQHGLIVLATQLDFSARDLRFEPGVQIPLSLHLPSAEQLKQAKSDAGTFLLVRNLPEGLTFSEGMPIGTNWVMSLPQAGRVRLGASKDMTGSHRLEFLLIGPGNRVLAETTAVARLSPRKAQTDTASNARADKPVAAVTPGTEPEKQQAPPVVSAATPTISREDEATLLSRGAELIGQGGIAAARLMFEELAGQGSSQGALAMARTYDPAYIAAAPVGSITPDISTALTWYKRAASLGSGEATQRLSQLSPAR